MREKQIYEIAKVIDESHWRIEQDFTGCHINSAEIAENIYKAGYRKQSMGEWIAKEKIIRSITALNYTCSVCGVEGRCTPYCPNCGAKMKRR